LEETRIYLNWRPGKKTDFSLAAGHPLNTMNLAALQRSDYTGAVTSKWRILFGSGCSNEAI